MTTGYPKFDGFSLQDDNFIMSEIVYRTIPTRQIESDKVLRRPGVKVLSADFTLRKIQMKGSIVADTVDALRTKIDELHANVTRKESGILYVESDRSATALVDSVAIGDPFYSQTYVPVEIDFFMADPFFYGAQQTADVTITSGALSQTETITISGSIFAEPSITYYSPVDTGNTTTSGISITYAETGEIITWSGTLGNTTLAYDSTVSFDYVSHLVKEGTASVSPKGTFAQWSPGAQSYTVTFSGANQGGTLRFAYQPRYL